MSSMILFQTAINNIIFNILPELEEEIKEKEEEDEKGRFNDWRLG